jgi:hypothetical protein
MEIRIQFHALAVLPSGKQLPISLDKRLGGLQSRSGRYRDERKLSHAGNLTPAVQPVDSRYTD